MELKQIYGLGRSLAMYYARPWVLMRMVSFYRQFLQPGDLAFDVGSHVGNRIVAWRRLGARVVAVEPQQVYADLLQRVFGSSPAVDILRVGLSDRAMQGELRVSDTTPTVSTFRDDWIEDVQADRRFTSIEWNRCESVEMVTLEDLVGRYGVPQFTKIDVEGGELAVLRGLRRSLPALSFEYIPVQASAACCCIEQIASLGRYEFNWSETETMRWCSERWLTAHEMQNALRAMPIHNRSGDVYARRV